MIFTNICENALNSVWRIYSAVKVDSVCVQDGGVSLAERTRQHGDESDKCVSEPQQRR